MVIRHVISVLCLAWPPSSISYLSKPQRMFFVDLVQLEKFSPNFLINLGNKLPPVVEAEDVIVY